MLIVGSLYWLLEDVDLNEVSLEEQMIMVGDYLGAGKHNPDLMLSFIDPETDMEHLWDAMNEFASNTVERIHMIFGACSGRDNGFSDNVGSWQINDNEAISRGVSIAHGVTLASNSPSEDGFMIGTAPGPGAQPWQFWGVFDGHCGDHTAVYLQTDLVPCVSKHLYKMPLSSSSGSINLALKEAFLEADGLILDRARRSLNGHPPLHQLAQRNLARAMPGSCALLSMFDPASSKLRVACVGDSRAVLGRWDAAEGKYKAIPLSVDQTGFNEAEVARIKAEHPGEDDILDPKTGRLLGLAVTRAFGDHRWKWADDLVKEAQYAFHGPPPRPNSRTPPYLTAEPEIQEIDIVSADDDDPHGPRSDFLIMASDGLWDRMSSADAVECVSRWQDAVRRGNGRVANDPQFPDVEAGLYRYPHFEPGVTCDPANEKELDWVVSPEYFSIEDENAAVCLLRQALGGSRKHLFASLLTMAIARRRSYYDDTTITVVFFRKPRGGKEVEEAEVKKEGWLQAVRRWVPWAS